MTPEDLRLATALDPEPDTWIGWALMPAFLMFAGFWLITVLQGVLAK